MLAFPNFDKEFLLEMDASGKGLSAVLAQKQEDGSTQPIAYVSRTLELSEKNYRVTEVEALAVGWAVKHYLYGHCCHVYTNHKALKSLMNTPHPSGCLARWGLALQEVDLHIHYRPGCKNANADALSRSPQEKSEFGIVAAIQGDSATAMGGEENSLRSRELIQNGVLTDERKAQELALTKSQYLLQNGVLYQVEDRTLRIIPAKSTREELFHAAHDGKFSGHLREAKIHELSRQYWWPQMQRDITDWCKACLICASRRPGRAVKSVLTPIPVAGPFDHVGVDVITFPKSQHGNSYAVVFVDYLTKWPEVFPVADQTTLTTARLLLTRIIPQHSVPAKLLSDRRSALLS